MRFVLLIAAFLFLYSCATVESNEISFTTDVSGEMMFEGANTLQGSGSEVVSGLAGKLEIKKNQITDLRITEVEIKMPDADRDITESLLLQIVSDGNELMSLGSLNPVPSEGAILLNMAEDTQVLDHLRDEGSTWVLDLNLSEDHMEEMSVTVNFKGEVEYKQE